MRGKIKKKSIKIDKNQKNEDKLKTKNKLDDTLIFWREKRGRRRK
jgi:hypothetical protein